MVKKIAILFCLLAFPLLGESLSGEYGVAGFNPYTMKPYQGKAVVKEKGDIYNITWHITPTGQIYSGTGIRHGDTLAVAFKNLTNDAEVGVYTYTINDDSIAGKWIFLGRDKKGSETLKRIE